MIFSLRLGPERAGCMKLTKRTQRTSWGGRTARAGRAFVAAALSAVLLAGCAGSGAKPVPEELRADGEFVLKGVSGLTQVAQLTGRDSINRTHEYEVYGTDLGSMFNVGDVTYMVFGDTFGYRSPGMTGGGGSDWRSNTLAVITDDDPSDGLTFDTMMTDYGNHAKELLPSLKVDGEEMTKIPTHGIAVGNTLYLYFMSVNHWGPPGVWYANYGGLAKSTDGGKFWTLLEDVKWPGDSNFIQVSPYPVKINDSLTEIYLWCIPAGRFGGVKLMKVDEKSIEDFNAYRYFAGLDKDGEPIWSSDMNDAELVASNNVGVGELSVIWNPYLERWIMTYLKEGTGVVIREGIRPWGPWGEEIVLVPKEEYPGLYAPFMNPRYLENGGRTVYFTLSLWDPYNVFWMKVDLEKAEEGTEP